MSNFDAIQKYFDKGWQPVPLPPRKKRFPPKGFTGRGSQRVEQKTIDIWRNTFESDCNVALHLTTCQVEVDDGFGGKTLEDMDVIGIDVDNYGVKVGGKELADLEEKLGPLPKTIISTARTDGDSGIRLFLVPRGLAFKGKPGGNDVGFNCNCIEIIQHVHRYMVCWPSVHPEGMPYLFYKPGQKLDGKGLKGVPPLSLLARLPDKWVNHLSAGGQLATGVAMDIESTDGEVLSWYKSQLDSPVGPDRKAKPCECMMDKLAYWSKRVKDPIDSHTPLHLGHFELVNLAYEGHNGVDAALKLFHSAWLKTVVEEQKRSRFEAKSEMSRSLVGALRRLKGAEDELAAAGFTRLAPEMCSVDDDWGDDGTAGGLSGSVPGGPGSRGNTPYGSERYQRNEDGNAEHFLELFGSILRWVPNYAVGSSRGAGGKWVVLEEDTGIWRVDSTETTVFRYFREVQRRQTEDAAVLLQNAIANAPLNNNGAPVLTNNVAVQDGKAWKSWAEGNGNEKRVTASLNMAKRRDGVAVHFEELDSDPYILAVANGVLRFYDQSDVVQTGPVMEWVDELDRSVLVTQTTGHPYVPLADQRAANDGEGTPQVRAFDEFMQVFIKDHISEAAYTYLHRFLGYSILGHNRSKQALFLIGKPHTGKTTFQTMISNALGDLAIWRDPNIFQDTNFKDPLAAALARRIVCTGEIGDSRIDVSLFKRIVGGDEVSCNIKNVSEPVTLAARCTVISGCNNSPNIPGLDEATRDRMSVVPFLHVVSDEERDSTKQEYLEKQCQVPVLAWLIEGCCEALEFGIGEIPAEIKMARQQFIEESSDLAVFTREAMQKATPEQYERYRFRDADDPRKSTTKDRWPDELCIGDRTLYGRYQAWCSLNGIDKPMPKPTFTKRLAGLGFVQDGTWTKGNEKRWVGVTLKSEVKQLK